MPMRIVILMRRTPHYLCRRTIKPGVNISADPSCWCSILINSLFSRENTEIPLLKPLNHFPLIIWMIFFWKLPGFMLGVKGDYCVLCTQAETRLRAHEMIPNTRLKMEKYCNKWDLKHFSKWDLKLSTTWFISRMKDDVLPLYWHLIAFIRKAAVCIVRISCFKSHWPRRIDWVS